MKSCNKKTCNHCKKQFRVAEGVWCYDLKYQLPKEVTRPEKLNGYWTIEYEEI